MRFLSLCLILLPLWTYGQIIPLDWELKGRVQTHVGPKEKSSLKANVSFVDFESTLSGYGGFTHLYERYLASTDRSLTYGLMQEANSFQDWLRNCEYNLFVPKEEISMRLGLEHILRSKNDQEVTQVLEELAPNLSTEKKVEFLSIMGGVFLNGYDNERANRGPKSKGIVTLRQLISAAQEGTKAGVCRDMSQALAQSAVSLGLKNSFVITYQTKGSSHATVLIQDPNDPDKTYNINYNDATTKESASALSHLKQDSSIPSVGTSMYIFNAQGKPLSNLPTHLGSLLYEMGGGKVSDLDPMLRSESNMVSLMVGRKGGFDVGVALGSTPDGDNVKALTFTSNHRKKTSEQGFMVVLYDSQRDTTAQGKLHSQGAHIAGHYKKMTPNLVLKTKGGDFAMNAFVRVDFKTTLSFNSLNTQKKRMSLWSDVEGSAGVESSYKSASGQTRVSGQVEAETMVAYSDVRDGGSRGVTLTGLKGSLAVAQKIGPQLEAHAAVNVIHRGKELGTQSNQEIGLTHVRGDNFTTAIVAHEGNVAGPELAFIPGSKERFRAEIVHGKKDRYMVGAGAYCSKDKKDCGVRATATVKLGRKKNRS